MSQRLVGKKGSYQVIAELAESSELGMVFRGVDAGGRPVVVKRLHRRDEIPKSWREDYDYMCRTFEREAHILLSHGHSQIVRGYDFFEQEERLHLIMEFIEGENLEQYLARRMREGRGPLHEAEVIAVGIDLAGVLAAVHRLPGQVLYRDLKPRNVIWEAGCGKVKLIDFGTARFLSHGVHPTRALGTPGYAPRELYSTQAELSFATDVYTLGATLYELATGEMPEALMTPIRFGAVDSQLTEGFKQWISKAMAQNPDARFSSAEAAKEGLLAVAAGRSPLPEKSGLPVLAAFCGWCGRKPSLPNQRKCPTCAGPWEVAYFEVEGERLVISSKERNLVGRVDRENRWMPDIDLSPWDAQGFVSRKHFQLIRRGRRHSLEILNATNGLRLNGYPPKAGRLIDLNPGDTIEAGTVRCVYKRAVIQVGLEEGNLG